MWGQEVEVTEKLHLEQLTGKQLILRGLDYYHKSNRPDSALVCFALVANRRFNQSVLSDSTETAACAEALNLMGITYEKAFFDFQKAYYYYLKSEQFAKENGYREVLPNIHNNMAGLLSYKESCKKRDTYNSAILNLYRKAFHEAWNAKVYNVLGVIAVNMSVRALDWNMVDSIRNELLLYGKGGFKALFFEHHRSICDAVLACAEGKYEEGLMLVENALGYNFGFSNHDRGPDSAMIYHIKSNILFRLGNDGEALKQMDKVIELSKRWNDHVDLCEAYDILFTFYRKRHENQMANKYELLFLREKDFLTNNAKVIGLDYSKTLLEIEQLTNEAEAMAMRNHMKSRVLWIVCFFTLLIICTLIMLYRIYRQVKEKNAQLFQKVQEQLAEIEEKEVLMMQTATFQPAPTEEKAKYQKNAIGETEKSELLHRIFMVMENADDVYSNDFTLHRLAELVDGNPNYVSQVINEKYNCNFNALLNEYRIREACRRINDQKHYGNQTLDGIAQSVGIRARSTFVAAFKKFTGMTPSAYQKLAKSQTVVS